MKGSDKREMLDIPVEKKLTVARNAFNSGTTLPLAFRETQLQNLHRMFEEKADEILESLNLDMKKSKLEATIYELEVIKVDIRGLIRDLKKMAEPKRLPINLLAVLDHGSITKEPYGVVLILGAWNYPFLLTLQPLAGAIAAGNCAIIKPSEIGAHSAKAMARLLPQYLDSDCYHVVLGDVQATKQLLTNKFDYIFCTGSSTVGRSVMAAAAPHLTPVTLELGGKSPCYIDDSADFFIASKRILWGKFMNLGQTCIAPDYILCSKRAEAEFLKVANQVMQEWYGDNLQGNPDMPRIINQKHFSRLKNLLDTTRGNVVFGGKSDENDLWIDPTIVANIEEDDPLMQEEIFGPILPIVSVNSVEEAITFIRSKPKPLALYTFAKNMAINDKLVANTSSGGVCVNDVIWHCAWQGLPFGGIGNSGMGSYHGTQSFDTFSHSKSILTRSFSLLSEKLGEARYPPYTNDKLRFFTLILRYFNTFNMSFGGVFTHSLAIAFGAAAAVLIYFFGFFGSRD